MRKWFLIFPRIFNKFRGPKFPVIDVIHLFYPLCTCMYSDCFIFVVDVICSFFFKANTVKLFRVSSCRRTHEIRGTSRKSVIKRPNAWRRKRNKFESSKTTWRKYRRLKTIKRGNGDEKTVLVRQKELFRLSKWLLLLGEVRN